MRRPTIKEIAGLIVEQRANVIRGSVTYEVEEIDLDEIIGAYLSDEIAADPRAADPRAAEFDIDLSGVLDDEDEFKGYGWADVTYEIQYVVTVESDTRDTPGSIEVTIEDVDIDSMNSYEESHLTDEHMKMIIKYFYGNVSDRDGVRDACLNDAGL